MKKSFLPDQSAQKKNPRSQDFSIHSIRVHKTISVYLLPCLRCIFSYLIFSPPTLFELFFALRSFVHLARDFTTSRKVGSLFPALPISHISSASHPLASVSFDYRRETCRLSAETAARAFFLFYSLNVCDTQMAPLANNRSRRFPRSRHDRPAPFNPNAISRPYVSQCVHT